VKVTLDPTPGTSGAVYLLRQFFQVHLRPCFRTLAATVVIAHFFAPSIHQDGNNRSRHIRTGFEVLLLEVEEMDAVRVFQQILQSRRWNSACLSPRYVYVEFPEVLHEPIPMDSHRINRTPTVAGRALQGHRDRTQVIRMNQIVTSGCERNRKHQNEENQSRDLPDSCV